MGACLIPKKNTVLKQQKPLSSQQRNILKQLSRKNQITATQNINAPIDQIIEKKVKEIPFKEIYEQQIFHQFQLIELLNTATTLQGPKLMMNRVNGTMKACRILRNSSIFSEERLIKYKEVTKSEIYKIGEYYIIISELLTGPTLMEYLLTILNKDCTDLIKKVCEIIKGMHEIGIYHGNLTFDSFRFDTQRCKEIKLCEFNFLEKSDEFFNMVHKNKKESDWEFIGLLISAVNDGAMPYYSRQSLQYKNLSTKLIETFLQGRNSPFQNQQIIVSPLLKKINYAYLLRMNIYKLLKLKQRRKRFQYEYFYDVQTINETRSIKRPIEDIRAQIERQRINIQLKKNILPNLEQNHLQEYLKIPIGGNRLNEFKSVFKLESPQKKFDEIIYKLVNILV